MKIGDLITIDRCPWDARFLFGYKNGDLAIILDDQPYRGQVSLESIRVYVFASEKTVTIPTLYATKIGE